MEEKKVVLITGYEPFGGDTYNPSLEVARRLAGMEYGDYVFRHAEIPVNRKKCVPAMIEAIEKYHPEIVVCTGLAGGRTAVGVERVAINVTDFPIPDNEGYISLNEIIDPDGPAAYFSTLPIRAIVKQVREAGIPAYVSNTAGTFCCNMVMYGTLNYLAKNNLAVRAGFVHVPFTPEMVAEKDEIIPTMALETIQKAIETVAIAIIDHKEDIVMSCGAVS